MSSALEVSKLYEGTTELRFHKDGSSYNGWSYGKPNSVGGIGVQHDIYNASDKTMKYITFVYLAYNQVGDIVSCKTSHKQEGICKLTGPIEVNEKTNVEWNVIWYNPTITKVKIKEVIIQYIDGTEETINGADLKNIDDKDSVYYEKRGKQEARDELKKAYMSFMVLSCLEAAKEDEETKFHVNQGLLLLVIEVLSFFIVAIPFVGGILFLVLLTLSIVFSIKGIADIKNHRQNEIPFIGKFKILK